MRVLLFDDSIAIQKVVRVGIENLGNPELFGDPDLKICESFSDARRIIDEYDPEVIVGAESLGGEPCGEIYKSILPELSRLVLLADDENGEKRLESEGYPAVLRKPFQLHAFRESLERAWKSSASSGSSLGASNADAEFQVADENEDTAKMKLDTGLNVDDLKSAFQESLNLLEEETEVRAKTPSHQSPETTIDVNELEESFQRSVGHPPPPPPKRALPAAVSEDLTPVLDDVVVHSKGGSEPARTVERRESELKEPPSGASPELRTPFSVPGLQAGVGDEPTLSQPRLEERVEQAVLEKFSAELPELENRIRGNVRLDVESKLSVVIAQQVQPKVEAILNSNWQLLLRSVTTQVRQNIEKDQHKRLEDLWNRRQPELLGQLREQLRNDVQEALKGWMGDYTRDILKEVAREEMQKLMDKA